MNNIIWTPTAWKEYVDWQGQDRKTLKRINQLILDWIIKRHRKTRAIKI